MADSYREGTTGETFSRRYDSSHLPRGLPRKMLCRTGVMVTFGEGGGGRGSVAGRIQAK